MDRRCFNSAPWQSRVHGNGRIDGRICARAGGHSAVVCVATLDPDRLPRVLAARAFVFFLDQHANDFHSATTSRRRTSDFLTAAVRFLPGKRQRRNANRLAVDFEAVLLFLGRFDGELANVVARRAADTSISAASRR